MSGRLPLHLSRNKIRDAKLDEYKNAARALAAAIDRGQGFGSARDDVLRAAVEWAKAERGAPEAT